MRHHRTRCRHVSILWMALTALAACGGETSPPRAPPPPPNVTAAPSPPPNGAPAGVQPAGFTAVSQLGAPPGAAPGRMPVLGTVNADPLVLQNIIAGALAGGAAMLGSGGEQAPLERGIQRQAEASARGMRPEGPLRFARLSSEGHAESSLTLEPGACYTIVGFGGTGVFDYQLHVMTAPPMPPQVLAQSAPGGVTPVVGANEQCLRNPLPLPLVVEVDLHLVRGQGLVGAQVYRR